MKYLGVKVVDATPLNSGAAVEKGYRVPDYPLCDTVEGYEVTYEDGYRSWCPKEVFNKNNVPLKDMTYGMAIEAIEKGFCIARRGWNGKNLFVCKQVPSFIRKENIAIMQSLPESAKKIISSYDIKGISYLNQMIIVNSEGIINSWVASSSDTYAHDWYIINL